MYIYEHTEWPKFTWDNNTILPLLATVRNLQGKLIGKMENLGFDLTNESNLETLTLDVVKSSEIEGESLDSEQVRSSIARRLGLDIPGLIESDRNVEGMVDMMMEAVQNYTKPLSAERLFDWHSALFPTGKSGMYRISVGDWRNDATGPMQVISGPIGKETVHFQAPDARLIPQQMEAFINWFNTNDDLEPVIKAGLAHLWFVTIHPFDDGNGRIARALTDMLLARSDGSQQRFYSLSAQIRLERKGYYEILESVQNGDLDITKWLLWFLNCLLNAINSSDNILAKIFEKAQFWKQHSLTEINQRQRAIINKLLNGFEGNLTTSKWAKIAKCSQDTALRDIQDLISKNILRKTLAGGRSTNYELIIND
ncbi:MAG: Fic family protein [bacterium]